MSTASKKGAANKDKDKAQATYSVSDVVLGKVRGYQPWPGMIVDPDSTSEEVAAERPNGKKTHFYCVRFFPKGDHAWLTAKDISRLQSHEISGFLASPQKNAELVDGYKIAQDPRKWQEEMDTLAAEAAEEAANAEVDELDDADAEGDAKTKKRKREGEAKSESGGGGSAKPSAAKKKGGAGGGAKGRKSNGKSKTLVESEDDAERADADGEADNADDAGPSKALTSPPPAKKSKRDKDDPKFANDPEAQKVKNWRHTLQKTFLTDGKVPKAEDMPQNAELFTAIEQYDGMTEDYLLYSKIPKVMRHIFGLGEGKIPRDEEFNFRQRAKALFEKWQGSGANANAGPKSKANGTVEESPNGNANVKDASPDAALSAVPVVAEKAEDPAPPAPAAEKADVTMSEA